MYKLLLTLALATTPVLAQTGPNPAEQMVRSLPRSIGVWADWEVFTSQEASVTVCYALSRPFSSVPLVAGRGEPILIVAMWPGRRDVVTLTAGSADTGRAQVELRVGSASFPFDTGPNGIFARDGTEVVAAMERRLQAIARFVHPGGARATDTYSLRGFRAAYGALRRACPVS